MVFLRENATGKHRETHGKVGATSCFCDTRACLYVLVRRHAMLCFGIYHSYVCGGSSPLSSSVPHRKQGREAWTVLVEENVPHQGYLF